MTHLSLKRNMVPKAVLMRLGLVSLTTAKPVNTAQPRTIVSSARPMTNIFNTTHSTVKRPINKNTLFKNSNQRVNTVRGNNVNTARPKAVVNVVKRNYVNAVKASFRPYFLNAHTIKYALTVNHTTYISCIEQFWTTAKVKTVNGEVHLQALVNGKKIIINESTVRRDLQLEDAEGVDCLPNATIF
ncbi:hypothetical protein Tco_1339077 [Tanacetum coccineum]